MLNPRVTKVIPNPDKTLTLVFTTNEKRLFDVRPYLNKGIFKELSDDVVFKKVRVSMGSVQWPNGQDFCPDTLYEESEGL